MPKQLIAHRLIIGSLRDVKAYCACQLWEYALTTTGRDTDGELRNRAHEAWSLHLATSLHRKEDQDVHP